MAFELKNFDFSPDLKNLSGGNFKAFLKERYGKKYTAAELKQVFEKFYGTDKILKNGKTSTAPKKSKEGKE